MKLKKLTALLLAALMALSMVACGGGKKQTLATDMSGELVVWTLANDLIQFSDKFMEAYPDVTVETIVIAPADYPTKLQTALLGGETEPDIIVGEPQMLGNWYEAGFFANLDEFGAQDYAGDIVDYVWKVGQSPDGAQRAISYQITPAGFYYRRDIAKEVFGTDDPEEIGKLFADYDTMLETGRTLKEAGYRIFASDAEFSYFAGDSAWVIDNKLNLNDARVEYMDMCVAFYQEDLTAYAAQWTAPWYQGMSGEVPVLTEEVMWGDWADDDGDGQAALNVWDAENFNANVGNYTDETTEIFAYGLPAWGVLTMRDNVGDLSGSYGVCAGPAYGFGGGTFIGISEQSERKALAWEYVKFCTLTESTLEWWIEASQGDTVSLIPVLEKHKNDENPVYGNQKLYSFWLEQAEGIDYSKVTKYDTLINDAWGAAITDVKQGTKTKDEAINEFYDKVAATYPELTIER